MYSAIKIIIFSFFIYFFSWFLLYKLEVNTLPIQSEDTLPAMFLPFSIIKDKTLYLDKYYDQMKFKYPHPDDKSYVKGLTPFYLKKVSDHYVSAFTIITPILALPVYMIAILFNVSSSWESLTVLSHIVSSLIVATSGGIFYLLVKEITRKNSYALLLSFVYLFSTVNFAMLSQSLWQHGTLELFLLLGVYFMFKGLNSESTKFYIFFSGLFLGLAVLSRPTGLLSLGLLSLYLILKTRSVSNNRYAILVKFSLGIVLCLLFFLWYNKTFYLFLSNQGYSSQLLNSWAGDFPLSFLGVWLSPSKGILIYSPVFIFSLIGFVLALRDKLQNQYRSFYILSGVIVLIHTLVMSFWKHWYGGYSFGYRMSSDVIPFLILLLIPFVQSDLFFRYKKIFIISICFSFLVQIYGLIFFDGIWHAAYDRGFTDTSWLWSIKNSEFMFNVRRVMVKFGFIERACAQCLPGR